MLIHCPICRDLFTESCQIVSFPCGHVFHDICQLKWLDKSLTCPQCRTKVKKNSAFKVYFSVLNQSSCSQLTASNEVAPHILTEQLQNANGKVKEMSREKEMLNLEKNKLEDKVKQLMDEICKKKEHLKEEEVKNKLLKYEVTNLQRTTREVDACKKENTELQKKIKTFKLVQDAINGCAEDIDKMIKGTTDLEQLSTWCCIYRKELDRKKADIHHTYDVTRQLRKQSQTYHKKLTEATNRLKVLEETCLGDKEVIEGLEEQIKSLTKKNLALQASIDSPRQTSKSLIHRLLHESPAPLNVSNVSNCTTPLVSRVDKVPRFQLHGHSNVLSPDGKGSRKRRLSGSGNSGHDTRKVILVQDDENSENKSLHEDNNLTHNVNNDNGAAGGRATFTKHSTKNKFKKALSSTSINNDDNNLFNLNIFKKHSKGTNSSAFLTSNMLIPSSQSSPPSPPSSSSSMVCRKGYDGFGGQAKFVGPSGMRKKHPADNTLKNYLLPKNSSISGRNLGPSTNSTNQPVNKKLQYPAISLSDIDHLF